MKRISPDPLGVANALPLLPSIARLLCYHRAPLPRPASPSHFHFRVLSASAPPPKQACTWLNPEVRCQSSSFLTNLQGHKISVLLPPHWFLLLNLFFFFSFFPFLSFFSFLRDPLHLPNSTLECARAWFQDLRHYLSSLPWWSHPVSCF